MVNQIEYLLNEIDSNEAIDLRPYYNVAAIFVTGECNVARIYTLFRSLGIRHLPIVNDDFEVIGIITRKEIMSDFSRDLFWYIIKLILVNTYLN